MKKLFLISSILFSIILISCEKLVTEEPDIIECTTFIYDNYYYSVGTHYYQTNGEPFEWECNGHTFYIEFGDSFCYEKVTVLD